MLETVEDMLAELGDPDLTFDCIQVAGTNGKTSTTRYTAAILMGEGYRTALYTSPELVSYTERMEVDGRPVSEEQFARGISAAVEAGRARERAPLGGGGAPVRHHRVRPAHRWPPAWSSPRRAWTWPCSSAAWAGAGTPRAP